MITLTFDRLDKAAAEALLAAYHPVSENDSSVNCMAAPPILTPAAAPAAPIAPLPASAPLPPVPQQSALAAPVPTAAAPAYTLEQLSVAAAPLLDAGRVRELQELIRRFGCGSLMELPQERYGEYATALRAMGARI